MPLNCVENSMAYRKRFRVRRLHLLLRAIAYYSRVENRNE